MMPDPRLIFAIFLATVSGTIWALMVTPVAAFDAPPVIMISGGPYVTGSDRAERDTAYDLDEAAYGHRRTREWEWYEGEGARRSVTVPGYRITRHLITNGDYAIFVRETGHPAPDVTPETWAGYKLIHPYERTRRHAWIGGAPPEGRSDHPVVMVSISDAKAYAGWLSKKTGKTWRLPTEREWEKAARGVDGRMFPWGNDWRPEYLNSHDKGPFDTLPVGGFIKGQSPFGLMDAAGQVFEWTSTPAGKARHIVKGGSWDDSGCGICRPAARHSRPDAIKHILIGFRLVHED